jgi:hypothetical protein
LPAALTRRQRRALERRRDSARISVCTRRHRSLGIEPTPIHEYLGQSVRPADHQVVAGVDRNNRPHTADRSDAPALRFDRQRAIAGGEDPRPRHTVGHSSAVNILQGDAGRLRIEPAHGEFALRARHPVAERERRPRRGQRSPFAFPFILAVSRPANLGASILPRN